jgi:hypothetical protein
VIKRKEKEVNVYYAIVVRVSEQVTMCKSLYCGSSFLYVVGDIVGEYFIITSYEKGRTAVGTFNGIGSFFQVNDSAALTAFSGDEDARGHKFLFPHFFVTVSPQLGQNLVPGKSLWLQ